jgi:sugar (pentulose or hexulose) kinase
MAMVKSYIAVDLGAESGRVMLGRVSPGKIKLEEVCRFLNGPIEQDRSLRWDFAKLFSEIKTGVGKAARQADSEIGGIGIDSWGVDFGLINEEGKLIENPYHYRDSHTNEMLETAFELMPKREIYDNTGIQFLQFNSLYQLLAMKLTHPQTLARARKLIFMADLVAYHLCGRMFSEYTLASTSQCMDMNKGKWSKLVLDKLNLPGDIMPEIVNPATIVGKLDKNIAEELGINQIPVIAVGSHDTADAVAAVPVQMKNWAYISSGTWSLMGIETARPIINDRSFKYEFTNEGGAEGTIRFLKNIMGLWLVQECRRQWQREGVDISYAELASMAEKARPFAAYIDPDYHDFLSPGNMPEKINKFLVQNKQHAIKDKGQMVRAILESLALKYRQILELIEDISNSHIDVLHIVGGGIRNELLCQFTADAINRRVMAGPVEATALGNIMMQAIANGQIQTVDDGRKMVAESSELKEYMPQNGEAWQQQYKKHLCK